MNYDAWRFYLRGRLLDLLRQPKQAEAAYRQALTTDPGHEAAAHLLAFRFAARGAFGEALSLLDRVVQTHPRNADAWYNKGYLHDRLHQRDAAIAAFREAVRLNPKLDRAWYGLGLALAAGADHAGAIEALEHVIALQPRNSHAWYQLGMAHHANHNPERVKDVIIQLNAFERHTAKRLILDAERADLAHLVKDLRVVGQD